MRKPCFLHMQKQSADQLCGNRAADQHLCFGYIDSSIRPHVNLKFQAYTIRPCVNPKFQASTHLLWLYSRVCVGSGWKPQRQVFS